MAIIPVALDDDLNTALDALCAAQGREKSALIAELAREWVEVEKLRRALRESPQEALDPELAAECTALAEQGMADYKRMLDEADQA